LQTVDGSALTLKWDALNRLREAYRRSDSALVAVYLYDAGGRRVRKTVSNGGVDDDSSLNGVTDFYYSGWRVLEEREPDLELGTDTVIRQTTYGNYLDEVWTVDKREGGVTVAQLNDGSGGERLFSHANTLYVERNGRTVTRCIHWSV